MEIFQVYLKQNYQSFYLYLLSIHLTLLHPYLAKQVVVDGEGAKKFVTINVINAKSLGSAKNIAFSIANSPLVKTAVAGEDPNWGRIIMAIGKSGEKIDQEKIKIFFWSIFNYKKWKSLFRI